MAGKILVGVGAPDENDGKKGIYISDSEASDKIVDCRENMPNVVLAVQDKISGLHTHTPLLIIASDIYPYGKQDIISFTRKSVHILSSDEVYKNTDKKKSITNLSAVDLESILKRFWKRKEKVEGGVREREIKEAEIKEYNYAAVSLGSLFYASMWWRDEEGIGITGPLVEAKKNGDSKLTLIEHIECSLLGPISTYYRALHVVEGDYGRTLSQLRVEDSSIKKSPPENYPNHILAISHYQDYTGILMKGGQLRIKRGNEAILNKEKIQDRLAPETISIAFAEHNQSLYLLACTEYGTLTIYKMGNNMLEHKLTHSFLGPKEMCNSDKVNGIKGMIINSGNLYFSLRNTIYNIPVWRIIEGERISGGIVHRGLQEDPNVIDEIKKFADNTGITTIYLFPHRAITFTLTS